VSKVAAGWAARAVAGVAVGALVLGVSMGNSAWAQDGGPAADAGSGGSAGAARGGAGASVAGDGAAGSSGGPSRAGWSTLGAPVRWETTEGGAAVLALPPGAAAMPVESLPSPDLGGVAGARVVLRKGVGRGPSTAEHISDSVYAICAKGPAGQMVPGMESVVFERLNELARTELGKGGTSVDSFQASEPREDGLLTVAGYTAEARLGPVAGGDGATPRLKMRAEGKHVLGYVGEPADVLVCSIACTELSSERSRICPALLEGARIDAAFVQAPRPSLPSRLAFAVVRRPLSAVGAVLGGLMVLLGGLVAAWPARKAGSLPGRAEDT
jgi:hypothetical protein